jgi:hypothetical protein
MEGVRGQTNAWNLMQIDMKGCVNRVNTNVSVREGNDGGWTRWNGGLTGVGHARNASIFKVGQRSIY